MNTTTIGDRMRCVREFRDLTQEELAEQAAVSVDTIRKLEQNRRLTARISTLRAIARALDVQLERLLGQPTVVTRDLSDNSGLIALRDAIQDVGSLPGLPAADDLEDPPDGTAWIVAVDEAARAYWAGEYAELSRTLPLLLRDGRAAARETPTEHVWRQLALAYQLAASFATQAGHPDWAFAAVEKQLDAARKASDPLMEGMGVSTLSWVLLRQGRWEQARAVAERKADSLEPSIRRATPGQYAVYGNLLVAAATPAARGGDRDGALELLNLAESAATRSGPISVYGSAFSVADVRTQQVNIALAGQDSDPDEALRLSARVDVEAITRPVHAAYYRVDVSQARYRTGDSEGALRTLLEVEAEQPEWIRLQTLAAATIREMLDAERRKNAPLRSLAARLGVDPTL
ncbi:helix-turn-helix domain-containing protein [Streptomyces liangshanensis]|uniref:helix-turn-helix domain-containing protein n=1 Tax=Streptomyces liangshanensis TaxID=2717324 RepID=UPI0036D9406E